MALTGTCRPTGSPAWSRDASIGDYGGELLKEDCTAEADEPYAAMWLRELHAMRGSAYTTKAGTLVDAENVAIARYFGSVFSRTPEKFRANATPARADERIPYWATVLAVPNKPTDPTWLVRKRCAAHFKAAQDQTLDNVTAAVSDLLGDAFVEVHTYEGTDLDTPPTNTYWPGVNPGDPTFSLGGGAWMSPRSHVWIETAIPAGMSVSDYQALIRVQLNALLDPWLPAHATFSAGVGTGFIVGVDRIGIDSL
jgi:hypothetical protein